MEQTPKRACIVGTAPSYAKAPFGDPSIVICGLNDLYQCNIPRADRWYDLHPLSAMYFRPREAGKFVDAREIPEGKHYIRPEHHLEWLQKQAEHIPVYLQDVPEGWPPNARRFPIEDVKAVLRARPDQDAYISSSPELMLAHLILEGFEEIHIYGIHLETEQEYRLQRPAFEWAIGRAMERGIHIVLPEECPLLKHTHVYGYERAPKPLALEAHKKVQQYSHEKGQLIQQLVNWPRFKSKATALKRMRELDALIVDAQQQIKRAHVYAA